MPETEPKRPRRLRAVADEELQGFACKRCGECCKGDGFVNVTHAECRRLAEALGLPLEDFFERYTHSERGYERWLIDAEGSEEGACVFLEIPEEGGPASCRVETAKPDQCVNFPHGWREKEMRLWCEGLKALEAKRKP